MSELPDRLRVGAAQVAEVYLDLEATVSKDCEYILEAGNRDIDLLVFPEYHVPASPLWYRRDDDFEDYQTYYRKLFENAVTVPGAAADRIGEAAAEAGVVVVWGVNEKKPDTAGTMYNSQVVFDRDGTLVGARRKLVPTREERLFHTGGTGQDIRAFDTGLGTIGTLMCGEHGNPLAVYATLAMEPRLLAASWPVFTHLPDRDIRERWIYARTKYPAFAGKLPTVSATGVVDDHLATAIGDVPESYADSGASAILSSEAEYLAGPKWEGEGIVEAEVDLRNRTLGKAKHDVTGHYNRFDIFDLSVNRQSHEPIRIVEEPRMSPATDAESAEPDAREF